MERWPPAICFCIAFVTLLAAGPARAAQRVVVQVEVPGNVEVEALRAELDRLGQQDVVELSDDGRLEPDIPGDGVWLGELAGDYARAANVVLVAVSGGEEQAVFGGVLRTDDERLVTLGFRLDHSPLGLVAVRTPVAAPGSGGETWQVLQLVAAFGWGLLVLAWVAVLVLGGGRGRRRSRR